MSDAPPDRANQEDMPPNGRRPPDLADQWRAPLAPRSTHPALHAAQDEWSAAYAADELTADERAIFVRHLSACASCQAALAQTRRIRALLSSLAFAEPTLDDRAQRTGIDDALAVSAEQPSFVSPDQPALPAPPEWANRPLLPVDRVALLDARTDDAEQGALADERLRAISPGRLATGAPSPHSRRGATGAMDPNITSGDDSHAQRFANRFDDPVGNDASHMFMAPNRNAPPLAPTPTPRRRRPYMALATTLLLVALAAGVFGALRARHGGPGTGATPSPTVSQVGHATPAPTSVPIDSQTGLPQGASVSDIQMLAATDGWAAGSLAVKNGTDGIILHYTDGRWQVNKTFSGLSLSSIYMVSDTEGWAVSGVITNQGQGAVGVVLHDQAGRWIQSAPLTNDDLGKVVMVSPTEGWIIGSDVSTKAGSVILHIQNGAWTKVSNSLMAVTDISMVSPTEGWIVGNDGTIGRYQTGVWSRWPQSPIGTLTGVQMLSATDGWAVGFKAVSLPSGDMNTDPFIIHYDGSSWQEVTEPYGVTNAGLNAISMDSATDGWAVGQFQGQTGPNASGLLFHYTNGQWTNVPLPISTNLVSVSMVSASDGWAVGDAYGANDSISGSLILHDANGVWTPYTA